MLNRLQLNKHQQVIDHYQWRCQMPVRISIGADFIDTHYQVLIDAFCIALKNHEHQAYWHVHGNILYEPTLIMLKNAANQERVKSIVNGLVQEIKKEPEKMKLGNYFMPMVNKYLQANWQCQRFLSIKQKAFIEEKQLMDVVNKAPEALQAKPFHGL